MSAGPRKLFSGTTEVQAVLEAAGHFGLTPAELAYQVVPKKHGFLRRPKVVIEVDPAAPRRTAPPAAAAAPAPAPRPQEPRGAAATRATGPQAAAPPPPRRRESSTGDRDRSRELEAAVVSPPPLDGPLAGPAAARAAAEGVAALAGLRVEVRVAEREGDGGTTMIVDLEGRDRDLLVARQGELLRSCEYLVRRMVRDLPPGGLELDSGGFRGEREETLRRRAAAAAEEVRRSGEPVRFEPLPAAERRVVHLAIQAEPAVRSESAGEGELRSVCVLPAAPGDEGAAAG